MKETKIKTSSLSSTLEPEKTRTQNKRWARSWPEIPDNATAHARGYLEIWPPNTQRKCMAEIKRNKIEQVLAYREQVLRYCRVLESFLGYSDSCFSSTNVTGPAFHRCLFSKLGSYNALYYRSLKSNFTVCKKMIILKRLRQFA